MWWDKFREIFRYNVLKSPTVAGGRGEGGERLICKGGSYFDVVWKRNITFWLVPLNTVTRFKRNLIFFHKEVWLSTLHYSFFRCDASHLSCSICVIVWSYSGDYIKKNGRYRACGTYGGRREVCTGFWWGNLGARDHCGDPYLEGRIILRWIFRKWDVGVWTGSSWLRIGTGGGHFWMR